MGFLVFVFLIFILGIIVNICMLRDNNAKLQKKLNRRERTWDDEDIPTQFFHDWDVIEEDRRPRGEVVDFKTGNMSFRYRNYK